MTIGLVGVIHAIAVLKLTAMAGNEFCVAAFIEPIARQSDEALQRVLSPRFAARLGKAMPFWYAASLLWTGLDWWLTRDPLAAASALLQVAVLALTLGLMVPINNRIAKAHLQPGWIAMAKRWDTLHVVRVVMLFVASGLLVFSR